MQAEKGKPEKRKIFDFSTVEIQGGRINLYWQNKRINEIFKQKRTPAFKFNPKIDYIDQFEIVKKYDIKGFEYGNWVTQPERFNFLICSHISLSDLESVLKFKSIGFDLISIGFGARGMSGAAAHFEPKTFAINLTRYHGWKSLAHEYGHAIDYYFGGFIDRDKEDFSLSGGTSTVTFVDLSSYQPGSLRYLMNDLLNTINTVTVAGKLKNSESKMNIKDSGPYWNHRTEIFARFFEKYVQYKLNKRGISNTFLSKEKYKAAVYVSRNDFNRALPKMEKLIDKMRASL